MTNKSSKSPTGEDREQKNEHIRQQGVDKEDVASKSGKSVPKRPPKKQENLSNRGYEEDQPHNPVRGTGSMAKDQQTSPAGEPDKTDRIIKNNKTGPGLG